MPHKKGHKRKKTTKSISEATRPNISSGPDTTFTASSSDQNIARRKVESKVKSYGRNPKQTKYSIDNKTGKYTAHNTVKKFGKGGIIQHD
tara:strand:- start:74 stop:343 length:270 start_codon:yes stop_codon:yes gene_type:complete